MRARTRCWTPAARRGSSAGAGSIRVGGERRAGSAAGSSRCARRLRHHRGVDPPRPKWPLAAREQRERTSADGNGRKARRKRRISHTPGVSPSTGRRRRTSSGHRSGCLDEAADHRKSLRCRLAVTRAVPHWMTSLSARTVSRSFASGSPSGTTRRPRERRPSRPQQTTWAAAIPASTAQPPERSAGIDQGSPSTARACCCSAYWRRSRASAEPHACWRVTASPGAVGRRRVRPPTYRVTSLLGHDRLSAADAAEISSVLNSSQDRRLPVQSWTAAPTASSCCRQPASSTSMPSRRTTSTSMSLPTPPSPRTAEPNRLTWTAATCHS